MKASDLIKVFKQKKVGPFIQVPCSILSALIRDLTADPGCEVLNPVNEAVAMGMAAGTYLATRRIPVVLMQNSGLCNTLNALTSLNQVYRLPVLYIITWRGQPGAHDAPEHHVLGGKLDKILRLFNIPFEVLSDTGYRKQVRQLLAKIQKSRMPAALVLPADVIEKGHPTKNPQEIIRKVPVTTLTRGEALDEILSSWGDRACYVTTNGFISRDAFHAASAKQGMKIPIFYMLGSMGHALPLGLGISFCQGKQKKTIVIDGDGGALMHLGAMASIPSVRKGAKGSLVYVVLDNCLYASTGGQPTVSADIDFRRIAEACGFDHVFFAAEPNTLKNILRKTLRLKGFVFIHARISESKTCPTARVSSQFSCEMIKENFMNNLRPSRKRRGV
jgi:phosphonopyruvate decarboxylase